MRNKRPHNHPRWTVAELIGDAIGVISIFGAGYCLLLIGHGLGLN
jgi:hypothetical protein